MTIIERKKIFQNPLGSLNRIIPAATAPAAPIPVHIAYESPNGNARMARFRSKKLETIETTITADGTSFVKPSEYFNATTQTTSSIPAANK